MPFIHFYSLIFFNIIFKILITSINIISIAYYTRDDYRFTWNLHTDLGPSSMYFNSKSIKSPIKTEY